MANVKVYDTDEQKPAHEATAHHGGSFKLYWGIAVILFLATVVEVALSYVLKEVYPVSGGILAGTMMLIAIFKAMLVILYYMHLKYEKRFLWFIFAIPFFLVSLLALALFAQP